MCSHEILHQNELGYTLKCSCRQELQLSFNNMLVTLDKYSFPNFCEYIKKLYEDHQHVTSLYPENSRYIYMETPCKSMWICFSKREIALMYELLELTISAIEVKKMVYKEGIFEE